MRRRDLDDDVHVAAIKALAGFFGPEDDVLAALKIAVDKGAAGASGLAEDLLEQHEAGHGAAWVHRRVLVHGPWSERKDALKALDALGPPVSAIPAIVDALENGETDDGDTSLVELARQSVSRTTGEAAKAAIELLRGHFDVALRATAFELEKKTAGDDIAMLARWQADADSGLRLRVLDALVAKGQPADAHVAKALLDPTPQVRDRAFAAVEQWPAGRVAPALPQLYAATCIPAVWQRAAALVDKQQQSPDSELKHLLQLISRTQSLPWQYVTARFKTVGAPAVQPLAQRLQSPDTNTRANATRLLIDMGDLARPVAGQLVGRLKDKVESIRWMAAAAVANLGADGVPGVPALLEMEAKDKPNGKRQARRTLDRLKEHITDPAQKAKVEQVLAAAPGFMGINFQPKTLQIAFVQPGSGAEQAGLQKGDKIVQVAGQPVSDGQGIKAAMGERKAGETVDIVVVRGGQQQSFRVTLTW